MQALAERHQGLFEGHESLIDLVSRVSFGWSSCYVSPCLRTLTSTLVRPNVTSWQLTDQSSRHHRSMKLLRKFDDNARSTFVICEIVVAAEFINHRRRMVELPLPHFGSPLQSCVIDDSNGIDCSTFSLATCAPQNSWPFLLCEDRILGLAVWYSEFHATKGTPSSQAAHSRGHHFERPLGAHS